MRHPGTPSDWLRWLTGGNRGDRKRATLILGGLEPEDGVDPTELIASLPSSDDDVVFWCLVALGRIGAAAVPAAARIRAIAAEHAAFGVRQAALMAIIKIAPGDPETRKSVLAALRDANAFVRREALQCMITVAFPSSGDLEVVAEMALDPDGDVARWAEIALRNIRARWPDA